MPQDIRIKQIATGDSKRLLLTNDGAVYTWGQDREEKQPPDDTWNIPKFVSFTKWSWGNRNTPIIEKISAGSAHYLALSTQGLVYGWGRNQGQLFRGSTKPYHHDPIVAQCFLMSGIKLQDICAAGLASTVLSDQGTVYHPTTTPLKHKAIAKADQVTTSGNTIIAT